MDDNNPVDQSQQMMVNVPVDDFMQPTANFSYDQNFSQPINYTDQNYALLNNYPSNNNYNATTPIVENNSQLVQSIVPAAQYAPILVDQPIIMESPITSILPTSQIIPQPSIPSIQIDTAKESVNIPETGSTLDFLKMVPSQDLTGQTVPQIAPIPLAENLMVVKEQATKPFLNYGQISNPNNQSTSYPQPKVKSITVPEQNFEKIKTATNQSALEIAKTLDEVFDSSQQSSIATNDEPKKIAEFNISDLDIPEETVRSTWKIYIDSIVFYSQNISTLFPLSAVGAGGLVISFLPYYILKGYLPALNLHFGGSSLWINLALGFGIIFSLLALGLPLSSIVSVIILNGQGKKISFTMAVQVGGRNFGVFLLNFLLYLAGVLMGLCLFIVPGIIMAIHGIFIVFVAFADSINPGKSFRRSWQLTHYYCWDIWLAIIGIIFLAIIALIGTTYIPIPLVGISLNMLMMPIWLIILYTLYSDVRTAQENRTAKNHWAIWSMLLSLVFSIALVVATIGFYPKSSISEQLPLVDKIIETTSLPRLFNSIIETRDAQETSSPNSIKKTTTKTNKTNTTGTNTETTSPIEVPEVVPTTTPAGTTTTEPVKTVPVQPVITPPAEVAPEDEPVIEQYPDPL